MAVIKDQDGISEVRKRLYERGSEAAPSERSGLTPYTSDTEVSQSWVNTAVSRRGSTTEDATDPREDLKDRETLDLKSDTPAVTHSLRLVIFGVASALLVIVLALSALYFYFGGNQVTGHNLEVTLEGPLTVGGGEVLSYQARVTNNNRIAVEDMTLIIDYPSGTRKVGDSPKAVYEERLSVGSLEPGASQTVSAEVVVFGEEKQERQLNAKLEYRPLGSGSSFYKEVDPLVFKINSAPLTIGVETLEKVSAGQDIRTVLTVKSNSPVPLKDIILKVEYPNNFKFARAEPAATTQDNIWYIEEIPSRSTTQIVIVGSVYGAQDESSQMRFAVGTAKSGSKSELGTVVATDRANFTIEQPFVDVGMTLNGKKTDQTTVRTGDDVRVIVTVENTLKDTIRNLALEISLSGNVLTANNVDTRDDGYYDSRKNVIRWEPASGNGLQVIRPGEKRTFNFVIKASAETRSPSFTIKANTYARRVDEPGVAEQLVGTTETAVRYTSSIAINRQASRSDHFVQEGPVPPVANVETTYTITLIANAGGNDVIDAIVNTSMPQYVSWKNEFTGDGSLVYNPVSKELIWKVGNIKGEEEKRITFLVGLLPSVNQIGTTPALLGTQYLRATDNFTSEIIRAQNSPLGSELPEGSGFPKENGRVQAEF